MTEPIPISALEHFAYCPRQCALIHVDGVWADNEHTVRGERGHRRADSAPTRRERGRTVVRGLPLWSERHGLTGRADTLDVYDDGRVEPVEYKIGSRHGLAADIQLCAQALCLEEMLGVAIVGGAVWYGRSRRRQRVEFTPSLRERTVAAIDAVRVLMTSPTLPDAPDDERCTNCQLLAHCMPGLTADPRRIDRFVHDEVYSCDS